MKSPVTFAKIVVITDRSFVSFLNTEFLVLHADFELDIQIVHDRLHLFEFAGISVHTVDTYF